MARRGVRLLVSTVRRMNTATGVPEALVRGMLGTRQGGNPRKCQRVLKRSVIQGYLMRKNHKYYFIPSKKMQLPSLVVMRRRARRRTHRARRGRSRRRSVGMYMEAVMSRSPARRPRRRVRRRTGGQQQVQAGTSTPASPLFKVEKKPSNSK